MQGLQKLYQQSQKEVQDPHAARQLWRTGVRPSFPLQARLLVCASSAEQQQNHITQLK